VHRSKRSGRLHRHVVNKTSLVDRTVYFLSLALGSNAGLLRLGSPSIRNTPHPKILPHKILRAIHKPAGDRYRPRPLDKPQYFESPLRRAPSSRFGGFLGSLKWKFYN
jgi:hypothetical protein